MRDAHSTLHLAKNLNRDDPGGSLLSPIIGKSYVRDGKICKASVLRESKYNDNVKSHKNPNPRSQFQAVSLPVPFLFLQLSPSVSTG